MFCQPFTEIDAKIEERRNCLNYIKSLHIEGFKKFATLDVQFNEHMNILVGENEAGKSTILDAIKAIKSIEQVDLKLHEEKSEMLGYSQLNVTSFSSGIKVNVIPDKAILQVDGRTALGEKLADIQGLVESALDVLKQKGEILSYKIKPTTFCPSYELPLDSPFLRSAKLAAAHIGLEPKISVFGATCEASLIAKVCPEVIIFGAGSLKQAHNSNEFVPIDELVKTAQFYLSCVLENT